MQRQIAIAVVREPQVSVTDYFGTGGTTKSTEAYDLYLRGIREVDIGDREAELRAIAELLKAVELDPVYVNAWVLKNVMRRFGECAGQRHDRAVLLRVIWRTPRAISQLVRAEDRLQRSHTPGVIAYPSAYAPDACV
jgi:hypothetical protein